MSKLSPSDREVKGHMQNCRGSVLLCLRERRKKAEGKDCTPHLYFWPTLVEEVLDRKLDIFSSLLPGPTWSMTWTEVTVLETISATVAYIKKFVRVNANKQKNENQELYKIMISQFLLGLGPAQECGWYTHWYPIGENWFSLSQWVSVANRFLVRGETLCQGLFLCAGILSALNINCF